MATIKIINGVSGSFPAQKAMFVADKLAIKTNAGGQKTYPMKSAIQSITTVSEHKNNVVVDVKLLDGGHFRAEVSRKIAHHWAKFVGTQSAVPFTVKEKTKGEVDRNNIVQTVAGLLIVLFFVYQCSGDSGENAGTPKTMSSREKSIEALIYCKDLVKSRLKAPHTADFPWGIEATEAPSNYFTVNSYVDAQNAFGATIRNYYTCRLKYNGGSNGWAVEDLTIVE